MLLFSQGPLVESKDLLLEKALRVATAASKSGVYSCQNDERSIEKCTEHYSMRKLTPDELDALKTTFLEEGINADVVQRMNDDVFEKLSRENIFDEIFKASVCVACNL